MASYMYEMCAVPCAQAKTYQRDIDMSVYDDIVDFQVTTNYREAKHSNRMYF